MQVVGIEGGVPAPLRDRVDHPLNPCVHREPEGLLQPSRTRSAVKSCLAPAEPDRAATAVRLGAVEAPSREIRGTRAVLTQQTRANWALAQSVSSGRRWLTPGEWAARSDALLALAAVVDQHRLTRMVELGHVHPCAR